MQNSNCYLEGTNWNGKVPHADQKYIVALRKNDHKLIEEIYQKHSDMINKLVTSNSGTVEEAKDVMQEAIITMYLKAKSGFVLTCSLKSFLYTICFRQWINRLKKDSKTQSLQITSINHNQLINEAKDDVDGTVNKINKEQFCMRILNMLSQYCKDVLKLSWTKNGEGKYYSWMEVAEELEKPYGAVRKQASKCGKRLQELARKDKDFDFYKSL